MKLVWLVAFMLLSSSAFAMTFTLEATPQLPSMPSSSGIGNWPQSCGMHCRDIWADGEIVVGDGDRLEAVIGQNHLHDRTMMHINSPGGNVLAALDLGRAIRRHKLGINVVGKTGDECISACTLVYMGGLFRWMPLKATYGIHRFFTKQGVTVADPIAEAQIVSGQIAAYLVEMGISGNFLTMMSQIDAAGGENYLALGPDTLHALGIVNDGIIPTNWSIDAVDGALVLHAQRDTIEGTEGMVFACHAHKVLMTAVMVRDSMGVWSTVSEYLDFDWKAQFIEIKDMLVAHDSKISLTDPSTLIYTYLLPDDLVTKITQANTIRYGIVPGGPATFDKPKDDIDKMLQQNYQFSQAQMYKAPSDAPLDVEVAISPKDRAKVTGYLDNCRH